MTKSEKKEVLLKLLFMSIYTNELEIDDLIDSYIWNNDEYLFTEIEVEDLKDLVKDIYKRYDVLDKIISDNLNGWHISRLANTELSILRMTIYYILLKNGSDAYFVNEAVVLTKMYGSMDNSYRFVNGILASIIKDKENILNTYEI